MIQLIKPQISNLINDIYEHNISKEDACNKLVELINDLSEHTEGKYGKDGSMNCGEVALKYGVPVGEIGCPYCGSIQSGAIITPICKICNNSLFGDGLNDIIAKLESISFNDQRYDIDIAGYEETDRKLLDLDEVKDLIYSLFGYIK